MDPDRDRHGPGHRGEAALGVQSQWEAQAVLQLAQKRRDSRHRGKIHFPAVSLLTVKRGTLACGYILLFRFKKKKTLLGTNQLNLVIMSKKAWEKKRSNTCVLTLFFSWPEFPSLVCATCHVTYANILPCSLL